MPFVSDAQRRWGHTEAGTKALGGPGKLKEWDTASKGKELPERVNNNPGFAKGGPVMNKDPSKFFKPEAVVGSSKWSKPV